MKKLLIIILILNLFSNLFSQRDIEIYDSSAYYQFNEQFNVDWNRVVKIKETEKYIYFYYDTTKAYLPLRGIFILAPFIIANTFKISILIVFPLEAAAFIGALLYTKHHIRKYKYIRIRKQ